MLLWVFCTLLFLISPQTADAAVYIQWKEQVAVSGPMLALRDLADLSGDDAGRVAVLQSLSMGQAPAPGQTSYLTGDVLLARLSSVGVNPFAEGWTLPNYIVVSTECQTVSRETIDQRVTEAITSRISYPKEDVKIMPRGRAIEAQIPTGAYSVTISFPKGIRFVGPTPVVAEIRVADRLVKSIYLAYDVQVSVNAFVVKNTVAAHKILTEDDIAVEKRLLSNLPARAVKDSAMLKSYWTRRKISPETVLTEDMLDIPPVVKKNSQVTIVSSSNGIFVTAFALAQQDGKPGDVIRVRNIDSHRLIMAKVRQDGTVVPLGSSGT